MNRLTISSDSKGLVFEREVLQERPPGNAAQRKKALRRGWKPNRWRVAERLAPERVLSLREEPAYPGGPVVDVNPDEILVNPAAEAGLITAEWAAGCIERQRVAEELFNRAVNNQFCLESGLI